MAKSNTAQHLHDLGQMYTSNTSITGRIVAGLVGGPPTGPSIDFSQPLAEYYYRTGQLNQQSIISTIGFEQHIGEPKPDRQLISPIQPEQIQAISHDSNQ